MQLYCEKELHRNGFLSTVGNGRQDHNEYIGICFRDYVDIIVNEDEIKQLCLIMIIILIINMITIIKIIIIMMTMIITIIMIIIIVIILLHVLLLLLLLLTTTTTTTTTTITNNNNNERGFLYGAHGSDLTFLALHKYYPGFSMAAIMALSNSKSRS